MLKEYLRGTGVRRAIASVLVAAECLSVVSVGLPAAYAEEGVPLAAVELTDRTTNTAPAAEVLESGQEETVTPAEAARLGEEAATSFADEAERAAEEAEQAADETARILGEEFTGAVLEAARQSAGQAEDAAGRARDAAVRAADEADWAAQAVEIAAQEAARTADEAQKAAEEAESAARTAEEIAEAARMLEEAAMAAQERDRERSGSEQLQEAAEERAAKREEAKLNTIVATPIPTGELTAIPEKTGQQENTEDQKTDSEQPAEAEETPTGVTQEAAEAGAAAEVKAEEAARAREYATAMGEEYDRTYAAALNASEQANRAFAASDRAARAAARASAALAEAEERFAQMPGDEQADQPERPESAENTDAAETADAADQNDTAENNDAAENTDRTYNTESAVTVWGEVPDGVYVQVENVTERYQAFDPRAANALTADEAGVSFGDGTAAEKSCRVLAAYDISLSLNGEEYQPEAGKPLTVNITDPAIEEGLELEVWHIHDSGATEPITDFTVEGGAVRFDVESFSVYLLCACTVDSHADDNTHTDAAEAAEQPAPIPQEEQADSSDNAVAVWGEVPAGVYVQTEDVSARYQDFVPSAANMLMSGETNAFLSDGSGAERSRHVLAAYDISLSLNGEEYQPEAGNPLTVSITNPAIQEGLELEVWHIHDDGAAEPITDFTVEGSTVRFAAESFSVYLVVQITVTTHITAGDGNTYRVSVTYDQNAALPEKASLAVRELDDDEKRNYVIQSAEVLGEDAEGFMFARAFDISLLDPATGIEIQPAGGVKVSISLLDTDVNAAEELNLLHFGEEVEKVNYTLNDNAMEFTAEGFSVYVLIGSEGETVTPQCTYTFYVPDPDSPGQYKEYSFKDSQDHTVYNQTISSGEELIVPQITSTDDKTFAGWYKGDRTGGILTLEEEPYNFDNIIITENSAIDLYAVYKNYATVTFHDKYDSDSDSFPVAYTRRAELVTTGEGAEAVTNATVKIDDLNIANTRVNGKEMAFFGWSKRPITTPGAAEDDEGYNVTAVPVDENGCITVTESKDLYPIFIETHLLTFYAAPSGQGAAYNGPRYVNKGDYLNELPTTSLSGYTFTGWFTGNKKEGVSNPKPGEDVDYGTQISDANGTLIVGADDAGVYVYDGKLYLRADTTLYAGWADNTSAGYRILYWQQNGTGSDYTYVESVPRTGTVGETVSVSDADKAKERYDGFHLKEEPASAEVKADGSTVLNVYYDHNDGYVPTAGIYTLTFADSVTEEGKVSPALNPAQTKSVETGTILAGQAIENPASGRKGYIFSKWFLDPYGNMEANLDSMKMPDHDLTLYAGWEVEWYVVSIDPNYGELRPLNDQGVPTGTGSTWFWQSIEREPIAEYTYVERNYVESSSGTFFYVYHPGDGKGNNLFEDRYTYYTTDISKATEDTTFEYSPGTYTYAGWYEILEDGTEVPYVFGERTDHHTNLILHWKKNGVYYLKYNAVVDGLQGTMDDADASTELFENGIFADNAEITLTHSAIAPAGYTFVGWKVRSSDSDTIYTPGQIFTLDADNANRVSGKDVVYLDAVYARVGTASIIYDANGGTVAENSVDFGKVPGSTVDEWNNASGTIDTAAGTATVSGLTNNSKFKLSDGTGFTAPDGSGADFLGWSDKTVCDDSATFFSKDSTDTFAVNTKEPVTLYAVWGVSVTYNLNNTYAGWGDEAWDTTVYTKNNETNTYSQTVNIGNAVSEPVNVPNYTGTDGKRFRYWATRTGSGTEESPYVFPEYDFTQPITGALDLYAYWGEANTITVHAVDASGATLVDKTSEDGWVVTNVTVTATETALNGTSHVTETPENYEFAFVAVASDLDSVSESNAVTAIKYENKKVLVRYKDEASFSVLDEGKELYFVYYQKKALAIGYKSMAASGVLENVTTQEAPTTTDVLLGEYSMSSQLTEPLSLVTGFTDYAFAIGDVDPHSETQMNASNLSLITNAVGEEDPAPTLRVRNTWRGFEYTTETGENADWTSCGYEPQLYVIYYTQKPTVIMFNEKTEGTSTVMDTAFTFNLLVTQTTTTTVSVQTQRKDGDDWVDDGEPNVTTTTGSPKKIFDTRDEGNQPYILKNGEANSSILFYSSTVQTGEPVVSGDTRTVTTRTTATAQTAVITQTLQDAFTTSIKVNGSAYTESQNVYTYTANGISGTQNVTFTNTHRALPVEVHVAMVEGDSAGSGIVQRDGRYRNTTESAYRFDLALGESVKLLEKLPAVAYETTEGEGDETHQVSHEGLFTGDTDIYAFGAVVAGSGTEDNVITVNDMGAVSIAYEKISENVYELVLKDDAGNTIGELGNNQLYYLYYPMPKIRYVKEAADGTLTYISGCLIDQTTGNIGPSESVTYGHNTITMNGKTVEQNQSFEIPLSGLIISQSGNNFRMPPVLDDNLYERYLGYVKIGAGSGTATNSSDLDVSTDLTMQLKVQNNTLQYSFDGTTWKNLELSGTPTVYAIYSERGYDLQISKTVDMSESGEDALFSGASFPVTISSMAITKNSYDAEGADSSTVAATPSDGRTPGTITLTVSDGTKIRIKSLGRGVYTITESRNENYTLKARTGSIIGSTSPITVSDNTTVSLTLDTEKKLDLTNSPKAICRIDDHYFYTMRKMVAYVDENIATKTATAEMLTDYLMPAADTVEIPSDFNLTLTTAESVGQVAIITRTADLAGVPLFASAGNLTLTNLTLEGSSIEATAPMIQSAGNLTIGSGATIQNCVGGGAINATAGNITVSGTIQNCSAAEGGAIYHSGNGTITLDGTGAIQNNNATSGDGGAIWLGGGLITVSESSRITGNKAESGKGGAIFANSVVEIEIDQGGAITGNTATEGGAIYAKETATINIAETENASVKPAVTGNVATTGNGGAIYVNGGSISVSGGSVSSNKAEKGQGGAIYSSTASVTVSGTAEVKNNTAKEGGAVHSVSGAVTVSETTNTTTTTDDEGNETTTVTVLSPAISGNTASTGSGGAIYAGSGNVTVSGGSVSGNTSTAGSGGAVYAGSGNVSVSGGSLSNNTANTDGGAVFAGSGNITVSVPDGGTAPTIQSNTAATGKGGALYANTGAISITGTALTKNKAGADGGAVYAGSGAVTLTNSIFGGADADDGNTAGGSGGAIYAGSGNVTVSGGSMQNNKSTGGSGGALYAGSGTVTVSGYTANEITTYTQLVSNSASAGKGGAVYLDSGSLTLTSVTAEGNSAKNGAAIFTNTGRASFSAGSYSGNIASEGGAVGVGGTDARLVFNGNVEIKDNRLGTADDAPKSNVYLDQDDDAVINIDTLGTNASIGIYVPDEVVPTRSVPGARFAVYTSNSNANKITNDRYTSLTVQSDTAAKKFYWGNGVRIEVMYRGSNSSGLPNGTSTGRGTTVKDIGIYYPTINSEGEVALSELAADVYTRYPDVSNGLKSHPNATFGSAFYYDAPQYSYDISMLVWNTAEEKWQVGMRNGQTEDLGTRRIYVIYSEPAYISIENNTEEKLTVSDLKMTVNGSPISVINSGTSTGYGMVFAKNGAIRTALLPITASDLTLAAGQSVSLLIPGGQNMAYTLDGSFETTTGGSVRLRRGAETSLSEETVTVSATDGTFEQLTGTTLNAAGTYNIIFGDNKIICKVVDAGGTEHTYSKISDAIADIVATTGTNPPYTLATAKTAAIEMVTDYLLTASDNVNIPQGYDITLTTAAKEGATYCYNGTGDRATISRDTLNTDSMIKGWNSLANNKVVTTLRLNNLIFDGKSVRGSSDGGAVATQYVNVYVDTVDFKNVYASNGGALLVMFNFDRVTTKNTKHTVANTILNVKNSDFTGCTSTTTVTSNRLGGGAIVTNAETMTLEGSNFTNCTAVDQAGAVFHRIDFDDKSWTNVTGCTFTNCSANAAGGLEIDSKTINVTNCRFEHCVAKERNGGGFNVYALNAATPTADCWVTVSDCTFNDCQLTTTNTSNGNGGGFRCNAVYTKVINSTFTNNLALYGGGFCISNGNAKKGEVYGCTFERNTANQGGGIFGKPYSLIIGDGYYYLDNSNQAVSVLFENGSYKDLSGNSITDEAILGSIQSRHTEIKNCTSNNEGGGIYHDKNADNTSLTITNATISGNQTKNSAKNGGGVFTNCRTVTINGATITDNICTSKGGGLYAYSYKSLTITDSSISRNIASSDGGGVWFDADGDTNRAKQVLTINGSSIDGNTSGASGGGIYTLAKTVNVGASETKTDDNGKAIRSSVSNNIAKTNGGGIYQSRNVDGSSLLIASTNINGNTANNTNNNNDAGGGGIFAGVRKLTITNSDVSNNISKIHGGGILFEINNDTARDAMSLTVEGSTLNSNTSSGNGGGIYTRAKTVEIKAHTEGTDENAVTTPTTISNCTATWSGGGIYQNRDIDGSSLTVTGSVISGCRSNDTSGDNNPPRGGGGIMANVWTIKVTGSEIRNNLAVRNGGGIDAPSNATTRNLIIDSSKITGNSAGNQGGGVFTRSQLTLRNGTEITGNRLTSNIAANCAGVYLPNERTLFVGPEDADEGQSDTIIVRNNTTANGTLSDLRLWDNGSENNAASVYVYCNLSNNSEIRVVNAAKAGTQFGSAKLALTNGFSDDNPVFKADSSTLYGITDRTDPTNKTIIWAGPPIAKLTDGIGRLLYIKYYEGNATYPAIFDRLDTGSYNEGSIASPFSLLRMENLTLYYKDGTEYTGEEDPNKVDYCIKMLVEHYETSADMTLPYVEGRTVTFTTAEKNFPNDWPYDDLDTYHFEGRAGGRATVIRGKSVSGSRTLMNVNGTLNLENIVIDGGTENGVNVTNSTRCMYINEANCTVTIGENAVLQNGKVSSGNNGGGIFLNNGTLTINGGTIRNCAAGDGGGVFLQNGSVTLKAGSIYQCSAGTGGGVRTKNGTFTMTGGTIQGCSSTSTSSGGGGVCIASGQSMYMSGGSIINNSAQKTGGGIMVYSNASRLYFSGKVNISGNTSEASKATNKACNVELNQDFNGVINTTGDGLYPGAYIGVYVPDGTTLYDKHGVERKPFGNFKNQNNQTNTTNFYSFVNDRNGLKGGIIEKTDPNYVKTGEYANCCIYWIQIFSLQITKQIVSGASTTVDPNELFLFKVSVRGDATVSGQLNAGQIDSNTGDYGEMQFTSNGVDTTTAVFGLVDGQTISGVNLSEGLIYEVVEYLTVDQAKRYAAMPMNGAGTTTESLEYNGVTYQVIRANSFASTIGENKTRTDVDPYTSALTFSNLMPVCKITDMGGHILYRRYDWEKVTYKTGEEPDGGSSTNQPHYYAPAVYTELTGDDGAFKALEGTLYSSNGSNPTSYSVSNGVKIQMLIGDYKLNEAVTANKSKVTLTTASSEDPLFPKQDGGTTSTISRAFADNSMFSVSGDLTVENVILDGVKGSYTVAANGGIVNVESGGKLTIQNEAKLQNSKTAENYNGGAVYVSSGGTVTMTGGAVNRNESVGDGAGIYLAWDDVNNHAILNLSGEPGFGGTGTNVSGNIITTDGNFKTGKMVAKLNGGKEYSRARQDIYIEGYAAESDNDTSAASLVIDGNITSGNGTIWVWANESPHYKTLCQFAKYTSAVTDTATAFAAFRNAQDDKTTGADQVGEYLYGITKANDTDNNVFWHGLSGFDVKFKKIDGFGNSLKDAVFTLYTDSACNTAVEVSSTVVTGTSDSTGAVIFNNRIPIGVYYMKETTIPNGYANTNKYIVLVGDKALAKEDLDTTAAGYLEGITTTMITDQTKLYKDAYQDAESDYDKYAIFLLDRTTSKAVAAPNIARYGVMNIPVSERKVILRKVNDKHGAVQGASFEILRYDRSPVSGTDVNGTVTTTFTSGASGVFFVGNLPYGTYYLHETVVPDAYNKLATNDNWFILTVNENGYGYEQTNKTIIRDLNAESTAP